MRIAGFALLALLAAAPVAQAAEIHVLMPPLIFNAGYKELSADFTKASGTTVTYKINELGTMFQSLKTASPAPDVIFLPADQMEQLEKEGGLKAGTRTHLGRVEIGLGVRPGAPHPDISTVPKLIAVLKAAKSVVYTNPKGGSMQARIIDDMLNRPEFAGINKMYSTKGNGAAALSRGEAEMALQLECELIGHEGLEAVGPLPPELKASIDTATAVPANAPHPEDGMAFVRFMARPEADEIWKSHGLTRVH
jgi:molybdate transport system substrate-binding protein